MSDTAASGPGAGVNQRARITMSPEEVDAFLHEERVATMCSLAADGSIHAVAMWYGFLDGALVFETKARSQKVVNLRRDDRLTCLVEAGDAYEELRGVELVGRAEIVEDPVRLFSLGVSVHDRYLEPYTEEQRRAVEATVPTRVGIVRHVTRPVSWDHRKLAGSPDGDHAHVEIRLFGSQRGLTVASRFQLGLPA